MNFGLIIIDITANKWIKTIFVFQGLGYLTQDDIFSSSICKPINFMLFLNYWVICYVPQFSLFFCWEKSRFFFPISYYYEQSSIEDGRTSVSEVGWNTIGNMIYSDTTFSRSILVFPWKCHQQKMNVNLIPILPTISCHLFCRS